MNNEDISGIYLIKNTQTNKLYIGESKHIYIRWSQHKEELRQGIHYNIEMQEDYNNYGENSFQFILYQEIKGINKIDTKSKLLILEHYYINYFKQYYEIYNIRDSVVDLLMDSNKYMDDVNNFYKIKLKKTVIDILSSHAVVVENNRYELKRMKTLEELFDENNVRSKYKINNYLNSIPLKDLSNIFIKKYFKYINNYAEYEVCSYLIKDEELALEYLQKYLS